MNRAARRKPLFGDDEHGAGFLAALAETVERFDIEVHAYALMPNHYHLLLKSVRANLSGAMKDLGGRFTRETNRLHRWDGPLFRGRFRSELIEDSDYLLTVAAYIHLNPIRAGLTRRLDQHCWTSHRSYLGLDVPPEWLSREFVMDLAGGQEGFATMVNDLRIGARPWPDGFDLATGMTAAAARDERRVNPRRQLRDRKGRPARGSEEILAKVLKIAGAKRSELTRSVQGRGGNPVRRFAVWALSRESDLTQVQIAAALKMSETHVSHTLRRLGNEPTEPVAGWVRVWKRRRS